MDTVTLGKNRKFCVAVGPVTSTLGIVTYLSKGKLRKHTDTDLLG